jgi:hypothetical protein
MKECNDWNDWKEWKKWNGPPLSGVNQPKVGPIPLSGEWNSM